MLLKRLLNGETSRETQDFGYGLGSHRRMTMQFYELHVKYNMVNENLDIFLQ